MSFSDYYSGVQHIGIPTKNLEIAESFWTKLGFKKTGDFPVGNVIFMQRDNLVIETWQQDEVADKGRIKLNGILAKSSSEVKFNDVLTITFGNKILEVRVLDMKDSTKKEDADKMYEILSETRVNA